METTATVATVKNEASNETILSCPQYDMSGKLIKCINPHINNPWIGAYHPVIGVALAKAAFPVESIQKLQKLEVRMTQK